MPSIPTVLRSRTARLAIVVVAVLVVGILAFLSVHGGDSDSNDAATSAGPVAPGPLGDSLERRDSDDPIAVGPVDAPVVMVAYSDYQCPFCAAWSEQTLPTMMEYVERGELRIEFRDLNVYGELSVLAARAAYAAGLQGRYLDYHERLFAGGKKRPPEQLSSGALFDLARELGLDMARFDRDVNSRATTSAITNSASEGSLTGLNTTPAFVVDGHPIVGAQPTDTFVKAVDDALGR